MEIDMELYRIFYTVAKCENITKAASVLYISQPAITMNIKKLESLLNTTLFVRTKRGVILTNEGKILFEYVKNAMESLKLGKNRLENLKNLDTGSIKIGIGTMLTKHYLVPCLEKFHRLYPKITIGIDTRMTENNINNLKDGIVDIAIITSEDKNIKGVNIVFEKEIEEIFVANKSFKELYNKQISIEELNNYPLLLQPSFTSTKKFLDKFTSKYNVTLESSMDLSNYSLVIEFIKIGMGIGFINKDYIKDELKKDELFEIKLKESLPKRKVLVITKKDYLPSYSALKLVDIIRDTL